MIVIINVPDIVLPAFKLIKILFSHGYEDKKEGACSVLVIYLTVIEAGRGNY